MLAEIFLLKLEFLLRREAANRALSNHVRFVPIKLPVRLRAVSARA